MSTWTKQQLESFAPADDFYVAPFREDGATLGTFTFIWSVVADGELYVRPYSGAHSRWYQAAITQKAGRIRIAGTEYAVDFAPAEEDVRNAVDDAYRAKYATSPYLAPMIADGPRAATVRVRPARES